MRILDRYIARRFLSILLFALIAFIGIFIIVDLVERLDAFLDRQVPKPVIIEYYLYYIPYIVVLTLPIAMLLSSLFSIGNLARLNEIVAMKSAGLSLYRILLPVFVISLLVSCGALYFGEKVVPYASTKRVHITDEYLEKHRAAWRKRIRDVYMIDGLGRKVSMKYYDAERDVGFTVSIKKFSGDTLQYRIDAQKMMWQDSIWVLYNGSERVFPQSPQTTKRFLERDLTDMNLRPEAFRKVLKQPEEMSYGEMKKFIREIKNNGGAIEKWLVDLHLKIAVPFANFVIVLFGAPLSSRKRRGGTASGFGISLAICFIYFGIVKLAQTLGHNGHLAPVTAAWIANYIFAASGLFVLFKTPK